MFLVELIKQKVRKLRHTSVSDSLLTDEAYKAACEDIADCYFKVEINNQESLQTYIADLCFNVEIKQQRARKDISDGYFDKDYKAPPGIREAGKGGWAKWGMCKSCYNVFNIAGIMYGQFS